MEGESESNSVVTEEAGEREEPIDATPSPQQQTLTTAEESREVDSMVTEDEATKEHGTEDDDDVVLVEEEAPELFTATSTQDTPSTEGLEQSDTITAAATDAAAMATVDAVVTPDSPLSSIPSMVAAPRKPATTAPEPIVIDDEEEFEQKETSFSPVPVGDPSAPHSPSALSSTEADSEIRIASVTTLGPSSQKNSLSASNTPSHTVDDQVDMNLMITSVTSLQGGVADVLSVRLASLNQPW